jgi:hypothetical protein
LPSQKATYIFDQAIPEKDLLDELEITADLHEMLKVFQCAPVQTVEKKFAEMMKSQIVINASFFNTERVLREYAQDAYL